MHILFKHYNSQNVLHYKKLTLLDIEVIFNL